ncbi:MAG: transglycosylase domain-containing protein [Candidatus Gracilibacteria bacterium]|nr:transglycosylase domain-containing protein [Candidatus Gracilibacteria bacterium]
MKKQIIHITSFLAVSFITYCFLPVITYDDTKEPDRILLTDRNGIIITDKANQYGYKYDIDIDLNSPFVKDLLEIEDKNYYSHFGVDILSKLGAIKANISNQKVVSGGSTITEQYIKNKYFQNQKRTYLQKSREAFLAIMFNFSIFKRERPQGNTIGISPKYEGERLGSKDQILTNYLNDLYFGNNLYGVGAALEVYFQKQDLSELTPEEITLLISLIHNPGTKSLEETSFRLYFEKIKTKLGYTFDRSIYKLNKKENIDRFPFVTNKVTSSMKYNSNQTSSQPSPLEEKEQEHFFSPTFKRIGGREDFDYNKKSVSIDSTLQQYAKDILNKTLYELKNKNVTNGAIFAINPKTNEVLIYQGSKDYYNTKIDGQVDVIQALRQPGSTMKPFLYLMALQNGANPDDLLIDLNNKLNSFQEGKTYISNNYSLKEFGLVRFKKALGNSLNNASVRLASELGLNKVYDFYKSYGFKLEQDAEYYGYSLVLGNPSIKLEDLVMSYSRLLPKNKITHNGPPLNSNGPLPNPNGPPPNPLLSKEGGQEDLETEQAKFLLYDILSNPDNRDLSFGVNSVLNTSIPQAVKTGTSSDFRDNVIVSYHPDFVIGIWVGNNDNSSMIGVTGVTGAGYIWHQIIEKAIELGYIKDIKIDIPIGVIESNYCLDEKCFRKELIYKKENKEYYSRILDGKYSGIDLFEKISIEEEEKLTEFQIYLDD